MKCCLLVWVVLFGLGLSVGFAQENEAAKKVLETLQKTVPKMAEPWQKDQASSHAVVAADTTIERATEVGQVDVILPDSLRQKLSPARQKLITAYENFVKVLPDDKRVPEMLASAASVFWDLKIYPGARTYFKQILDNHPASEQYGKSLSLIVDSYWLEEDYPAVEQWARQLLEAPVADSLKDLGRERAAAAIFKMGERYEQEGQDALAAREYERIATDFPRSKFTATALLKAGLSYDKAGSVDNAAQTYIRLANAYPESKEAPSALWNAAFSYDSQKDLRHAAEIYERLATDYPSSEYAADALNNASINYASLEDWSNAARLSELYAQRFPQEAGEEALFNAGKYWIKSGDLEKGNTLMEQFTSRYPASPLAVEAKYVRGEYFYDRRMYQQAQTEFEAAVRLSQAIQRRGGEPNIFYRGEAYYKLGEMAYNDFRAIELKLPKAQLEQNFEQKKILLNQIMNHYSEVVKAGSIRSPEAAFRMGQSYEELAEAWLEQERDPNLDINSKIATEKNIYGTGAVLLEQAFTPYINISIAFADKFAVIHNDTTWNESRDSVVAITPIDTTENEWVTKAKQQLLRDAFRIGELHQKAGALLLDAPVTEDVLALGPIVVSEYKTRVLLAALPDFQEKAIPAFRRVLELAEEYNIEGEWIDKSKVAILASAGIAGDKIAELAHFLIDSYGEYRGYFIEAGEQKTTVQDYEYWEISDLMANFIDVSIERARLVAQQYGTVIQLAEELGITGGPVEKTQDKLLTFHYEMGEKFYTYATEADSLRKKYEELSESAEEESEEKLIYEDMMFALEDNSALLEDNAMEMYETGYTLAETYALTGSEWYALTLHRLKELDPDVYGPLEETEAIAFSMGSDTRWRVATVHLPQWSSPQAVIDDSLWRAPVVEEAVNLDTLIEVGEGVTMLPIWAAGVDSFLYARREIRFFGRADSAAVKVFTTAPRYTIYLDGQRIVSRQRPAEVAYTGGEVHELTDLAGDLMEEPGVHVLGIEVALTVPPQAGTDTLAETSEITAEAETAADTSTAPIIHWFAVRGDFVDQVPLSDSETLEQARAYHSGQEITAPLEITPAVTDTAAFPEAPTTRPEAAVPDTSSPEENLAPEPDQSIGEPESPAPENPPEIIDEKGEQPPNDQSAAVDLKNKGLIAPGHGKKRNCLLDNPGKFVYTLRRGFVFTV